MIEPDTGLTTAAALTKASGADNSDATVGVDLLDRDATIAASIGGDDGQATDHIEVLADSAYGTGHMLARLSAEGHVPVIKPWPTQPAVAGGFTVDDFAYDHDAGTLTCPAGVTRSLSPKGP